MGIALIISVGKTFMSKYAIIINGDTEPRHLKNVDRAINSLKSDGYEVFVADVEKPKARADHYNKAEGNFPNCKK